MRKATDPDLWTCKRCGLRLRDCRCTYRRRRGVLLAAGVALALLAAPLQAQCGCEGEPEPEPIVEPIIGPGIGPCSDRTPYLCDPHQLWLPLAVTP